MREQHWARVDGKWQEVHASFDREAAEAQIYGYHCLGKWFWVVWSVPPTQGVEASFADACRAVEETLRCLEQAQAREQ